jgi:hypothetical protein
MTGSTLWKPDVEYGMKSFDDYRGKDIAADDA